MDRNIVLAEIRMIDALVDARNAARAEKDFATSDLIRKRLFAMGVEVIDKKDAPATWKYAEPQWNGYGYSNIPPPKKVWNEEKKGWYFDTLIKI